MLYMKGVSAVLPLSLDYHAKAGSHTATQFHLCRLQFVLVTLWKMTTTIILQSYLNLRDSQIHLIKSKGNGTDLE